jgi:formaldehyde-activating enzyme involved in methanogenesis
VKSGFFLLNAAFAVATLNLISRGHFSLLVVIYPNILNNPNFPVFAVDRNLYWGVSA